MSSFNSQPKDIKKYPNNLAPDHIESDLVGSYSSAQIRNITNARLAEDVDPNSNPNSTYGSFKNHPDYLSNSPKNGHSLLSEQLGERAEVVKKHLVRFDDLQPGSSVEGDQGTTTDNMDEDDYSISHKLQGGSITRSIYKWQEDMEQKTRMKRSNSVPYFRDSVDEEGNPIATPSGLMMPGGFRRHHILSQAEREGRVGNVVTSNFIDFLALYGHFAGDLYPEDDENIDSDDEEEGGDISERTPLTRRLSHLQMHPPPPTGSAGKAVFLLVKSFVGTGVLFLPRSFYDGGMGFSFVALMLISFFGLHCMLLLCESQAKIGGSFGDMGQVLFGKWARLLILASLVVSQFGFSCTYIIFIAKNLQDVFYGITECKYIIPDYWFVVVQLIVYIPIAMLRKIKSLSLMALIADVFIVFGLVYLVQFNFNLISQRGFAPIQHFNSANFAMFIGTAIFTFEGIGLVIPIVQSMREPEKFPKILSWTMVGITSVFLFIGSLSYATFGDKVQTVVLSNLPKGEIGSESIQTMYALAIILSVPLQVFPIIGVLEAGMFSKSGKSSPTVKWQKNLLRILIVLTCGVISWLGASSLNHFVTLVGSFCCIPLSFIYPAAFHLKAIPSSNLVKVKNCAIIALGFIMMFYVTYQTIIHWSEDSGGDIPYCPSP